MTETPLGIYVHWPYCARICPYCDFNVYKNREIDQAAWINALTRELEYWHAHTKDRALTSLYFGGGTPSLASPDILAAVIKTCDHLWGFQPAPEITLEANPTDAEQARFKAFADIGINRLSLGVQSLRDEALDFLGRNHTADDALAAINTAQENFNRVTFDLIYARPGQSLDAWEKELREALSLGVTHLSLYQLTIEPGTAFAKAVDAGRWQPASDDHCADQFDLAQAMTVEAGLPAYETSNHATEADQSRHNLIYWRYQDYIGIGPGAHGRVHLNGNKTAVENHRRPEAYLGAINSIGHAADVTEPLDNDAQLTERLSMGLRLKEGVPLYADDYFYADETRAARLGDLIKDGKLTHSCGTLRTTTDGARVLNAILRYLLT